MDKIKNNIMEDYNVEISFNYIKDNYIKSWNLIVRGHKWIGRHIVFMFPILVIEFIFIKLLDHWLGFDIFDILIF